MIDPIREAVAEALFVHDYDEPWEEATSTCRRHWLRMADTAIRALDRTDVWKLFCEMANLLDGYMPVLEDAAADEAAAESRSVMPRITQRHRLKAATEIVDRAFDIMGITP